MVKKEVNILLDAIDLKGDLSIPYGTKGLVIFAHGSGSSRHSERNKAVASYLNSIGLGTLLIDLLTQAEEKIDIITREIRFNIPLLAGRLVGIIDWVAHHPDISNLHIGFFGASTGAAAALIAAAERPKAIRAVVSRGGRPDLAESSLAYVIAPTLFIVGGYDTQVLSLNRFAFEELASLHKKLDIVPEATHLFEEPGALEKVASLAGQWFATYLLSDE